MALKLQRIYEEEKGAWKINVIGEIDIESSENFKEFLNKVIDDKIAHIHLECSELVYIDSTGLGVLIGISKILKETNHKIYILKAPKNIDKLLNITGLNRVFIVE